MDVVGVVVLAIIFIGSIISVAESALDHEPLWCLPGIAVAFGSVYGISLLAEPVLARVNQ